MGEVWLKNYIPAGCLRVSPASNALPTELWILSELHGWLFFTRAQDGAIPNALSLPQANQEVLLRSQVLAPFVGLFDARWIQLAFKSGVIRVYLFPQDVDRRITNRTDVKLTKAMSTLLDQLDFSPATWGGANDSPRWAQPRSTESDFQEDNEDCSLLDRFNNLPSPDPRIDLVTPDSLNAVAMQGILDSKIPGLETSLYAHQRRSAALMLQREVEPGQMIDPRLRRVVDQHQQPWYLDGVVGLVLKEPRYYDGVSGGILAEEMGTGKTLICLTVILATRNLPSEAPDPLVIEKPVRPRTGSLVDMAAAAINRYSFPWKLYLASQKSDSGDFYDGCVSALEANENRACYELRNPLVETRTCNRLALPPASAKRINLSSCSLIIVPTNLVTQWQQEIQKHTSGLKVISITDLKDPIPPVSVLLNCDILLFSQVRFEKIERERSNPGGGPQSITHCPLEYIRFKRCIIDEGHKLGTPGAQWKSDLMRGLGSLEITARWVVTGTPTRGLYGVDQGNGKGLNQNSRANLSEATTTLERDDLTRIGNITSKYLKVRPWSNTRDEVGDTPADWNVYVMQPKHHKKSSGRRDCLKATLESLIIRNRLSDVSQYLPSVDEKVVLLDGSYQDKLSLNLFSMMIIFNSVQSQRTDQDYFFHQRQHKALTQLVSNLKQASFFGGVFYSTEEITKSLETAEDFLEKKETPISPEDHDLLKSAIEFGKIAVQNSLKEVSNQFHAMPLYLDHFPGGNGQHWSLDAKNADDGLVCTEAGLVSALQKYLNPCLDAPTSLKLMIESGQLGMQGEFEKAQALKSIEESAKGGSASNSTTSTALAGNTPLGVDTHRILKSDIKSTAAATGSEDMGHHATIEIAEPLARTQIISTVSAKLSYLIDSIIKHQDDEQIIIFYDNDNVAYYLAGVLEILQIQHLIYTRNGLNAKRRAQYVSTFTHNPKFRVLLMDITQAAFGLDMRSASRIYFINPVLNPQVEAQAIGRARRISQHKPVTVETLVLRDSIEEFMVERRKSMTQAEHRRVKSILDDRPMYEWILNAKIIPLAPIEEGVAQTSMLKVPQYVFGRGFGRESHPDEGLIMDSPEGKSTAMVAKAGSAAEASRLPLKLKGAMKRTRMASPEPVETSAAETSRPMEKKARIAWADEL